MNYAEVRNQWDQNSKSKNSCKRASVRDVRKDIPSWLPDLPVYLMLMLSRWSCTEMNYTGCKGKLSPSWVSTIG